MSPELAELVFASNTEFAQIINVSDRMVRKYRQQGRLVLDEQGRIVVAASLTKLGKTKDPARGGDRTVRRQEGEGGVDNDGARRADDGGYSAASTRERLAKAQLAELELAEKLGQLVRRDEVEQRVFGMARAGREAIMALPDRVAVLLAAESDSAKVHALLTAACRKVCEQMASGSQVDREDSPA